MVVGPSPVEMQSTSSAGYCSGGIPVIHAACPPVPLGGEGNLTPSGDKDASQAPSVVEPPLLEVPTLLLMFLNGG